MKSLYKALRLIITWEKTTSVTSEVFLFSHLFLKNLMTFRNNLNIAFSSASTLKDSKFNLNLKDFYKCKKPKSIILIVNNTI
jgi:hypothetical protein